MSATPTARSKSRSSVTLKPGFSALARMQQHVLDNGIGAPAVLHDLVEIVAQGVGQFGYFNQRISVSLHFAENFSQFIDQFRRDAREIVDEIQRVLDLMGNAGCQLTE